MTSRLVREPNFLEKVDFPAPQHPRIITLFMLLKSLRNEVLQKFLPNLFTAFSLLTHLYHAPGHLAQFSIANCQKIIAVRQIRNIQLIQIMRWIKSAKNLSLRIA